MGQKRFKEEKEMTNEEIELQSLEEKKKKRKKKRKVKKKKGKKDACYHKVRSRYDVWPSAYASGALVKCRKVGAKNWGNKSKKNESMENLEMQLTTEQLERMIAEEVNLALEEIDSLEEKKKKPCKKAKGKRYVKRVNGKCRSFGQAGKAKGGGDRIRPGTRS